MDLVRSTIASRFEIEEDMLILRPLGSASFLLILPTGALFERVYNGGRPIITTTARLHIMRWTRLHRSSAASLHVAVEVEIRGIPPHAWELSTAELLLDEYCGIAAVHPCTEDRRDVFQLRAWCSNPADFPAKMDLEIVQPPMDAEAEHQPGRRTLKYPISIAVSRLASSNSEDAPPPPPPVDEDGSRRRRRRRSRSPSFSTKHAAPAGAASSTLGGRVPVHAWLGPRAQARVAHHRQDPLFRAGANGAQHQCCAG